MRIMNIEMHACLSAKATMRYLPAHTTACLQKGAVMSEKKKKIVAYHEAGHALVGALMPEYDPVTKISIVPRGMAGGITFFAPSEERLESGLYSRTV
jgi:ATP-dependent Zn protease